MFDSAAGEMVSGASSSTGNSESALKDVSARQFWLNLYLLPLDSLYGQPWREPP
jgi:hypothetical protein